MKKIIYTRPDGTFVVVHPCEGFRLASAVVLADGTEILALPDQFRPVDNFLRRWPVDGAVARWAESEDEFIARIAAKDVPADATDVQIVDAALIPADRAFRNAWKAGAGRVEHDMDKCREIHKARLRELRAPKLAALDVDFMRALESGDSALMSEISAKKQALRDVTKTPEISAAKSPEELKTVIPAILK